MKKRGAEYVLLKMGEEEGIDLFYDGNEIRELKGQKLGEGIHGSGCTHSSALLCFLARGEQPLDAAVKAKEYTERKIKAK